MGEQLLVGDRGMEGGSCEVTHQIRVPCSEGTVGFRPEQTSLSQVLPTSSSIAQLFVQSGSLFKYNVL